MHAWFQVLPDEYINNADPGKYALLGAAAMLGGVVRFFGFYLRSFHLTCY